jgi:2-dehydro-3-deoxyphosphogluconate aldolase / (4S)-4-hydroxy-2-oxoglutarate aldolase
MEMQMAAPDYFESHLSVRPVIGIFRNLPPDLTVRLCQRAWDFGVDLVEIPLQDNSALESLEAALAAGQERGKQVGAGTVTTVAQLRQVHSMGAKFTVSPGFDEDVARAALRLNSPHLPGIATASEIAAVVKLDLKWVKAFPAAQLGPAWIIAQRAPFASVNFVATGGVGINNVRAFLAAGCRAVAIGSAFQDEESIAALAHELTADT